MPRLFTGIKIPAQTAQMLALVQGKLPGVRWMEGSDYHITLRFIGDISDEMAGEIDFQLSKLAFAPFEFCIDHLDVFGSKKPRTLFAGVKHNDALWALQREHEAIMQHVGLKPEGRKFAPHVTLARFGASLSDVRRSQIAKFMEMRGMFTPHTVQVEAFALFSARASRGGGPYLVEETYLHGL